MTCYTCNRDANDNPAAYYAVKVRGRDVMKCWHCLAPAEKLALDSVTHKSRRSIEPRRSDTEA